MYENTRKPNILANIRDKEVIHQNGSFGINYTKVEFRYAGQFR